jgi:nucleotide-binding universal stress UspA family protein
MSIKVLVPLDGSPLAERALPLAVQCARTVPFGQVTLVRAHVPYQEVTHLRMPSVGHVRHQEQEAMAEAQTYLAEVASRLRTDELAVEEVVYPGAAAEAVLETARARTTNLIVMSTHGRSGLGRWLYGSVADQVLRHAATPVLLVPAAADHGRTTGPPARLIVALDGSKLAEAALPAATELAAAWEAQLVLLRVVEPHYYSYAEGYVYDEVTPETERQDALDYVHDLAARLKSETHRPVTTVVEIGPVAPQIAETARTSQADLVVMATHGRGGLSRLVLGSVATATLQRAHVPLLLVRPQGPDKLEPDGSVQLILSREELAVVRRGLEALLAGEFPVEPARALLERLPAEAPTPAAPEKDQ